MTLKVEQPDAGSRFNLLGYPLFTFRKTRCILRYDILTNFFACNFFHPIKTFCLQLLYIHQLKFINDGKN